MLLKYAVGNRIISHTLFWSVFVGLGVWVVPQIIPGSEDWPMLFYVLSIPAFYIFSYVSGKVSRMHAHSSSLVLLLFLVVVAHLSWVMITNLHIRYPELGPIDYELVKLYELKGGSTLFSATYLLKYIMFAFSFLLAQLPAVSLAILEELVAAANPG